MSQPNVIQNPEIQDQIKEKVKSLLEVPVELQAVIPGSIWGSLLPDQRIELMRQHNILDKYVGQQTVQAVESAPQGLQAEVPQAVQPITNETNVQPTAPVVGVAHPSATLPTQEAQAFQQAVAEARQEEVQMAQPQAVQIEQAPVSIEKTPEQLPQQQIEQLPEVTQEAQVESSQDDDPDKSVLQKDHMAIIAAKEAADSNGQKKIPKFSGYQLSENLVQNSEQVAENGEPEDSSTWSANILQKIWKALFNSA